MTEDLRAHLKETIERLRRRHAAILREFEGAREPTAEWTFAGGSLRWHVALEQVLEPDIDVEIASELVIVRARSEAEKDCLLVVVLPVPVDFDVRHARIRFDRGYLEIQVARAEGPPQ